MRSYAKLRYLSEKSLSISAEVVGLNRDFDYEIELDDLGTFIRSIELADYANDQYKAELSVSLAIRINGPEYVYMRCDGEFKLDDCNEIIVPIKQILIYDTTIVYSDPEICEEVYAELGEDAYLAIEVTCQ